MIAVMTTGTKMNRVARRTMRDTSNMSEWLLKIHQQLANHHIRTATSAQLSNADNITTVTNQSTIQSYRLIMTFVYGFTNVPVDAKR